jgi:hypothetical protein
MKACFLPQLSSNDGMDNGTTTTAVENMLSSANSDQVLPPLTTKLFVTKSKSTTSSHPSSWSSYQDSATGDLAFQDPD